MYRRPEHHATRNAPVPAAALAADLRSRSSASVSLAGEASSCRSDVGHQLPELPGLADVLDQLGDDCIQLEAAPTEDVLEFLDLGLHVHTLILEQPQRLRPVRSGDVGAAVQHDWRAMPAVLAHGFGEHRYLCGVRLVHPYPRVQAARNGRDPGPAERAIPWDVRGEKGTKSVGPSVWLIPFSGGARTGRPLIRGGRLTAGSVALGGAAPADYIGQPLRCPAVSTATG